MDIASKISAYDFMTMMVSGFLILLMTGNAFNDKMPNIAVFLIACYIVGMVYHRIVERLFKPMRNMKCCIECAYDDVAVEIKHDFEQRWNRTEIMHEYYKAYYIVMKNGCLGNIPVLETQVAFMRNISILLIAYACAVPCGGHAITELFRELFCCPCAAAIVCSLLAVCLIIIMMCMQRKIHYLVWHAAYYLK